MYSEFEGEPMGLLAFPARYPPLYRVEIEVATYLIDFTMRTAEALMNITSFSLLLCQLDSCSVTVLAVQSVPHKTRLKEAILIRKHANFNQSIGLAINSIWDSDILEGDHHLCDTGLIFRIPLTIQLTLTLTLTLSKSIFQPHNLLSP